MKKSEVKKIIKEVLLENSIIEKEMDVHLDNAERKIKNLKKNLKKKGYEI